MHAAMIEIFIPPLTKFSDGVVYTRMPKVEQQLAELVALPFDEIIERCAIKNRGDPNFILPECLIHLIRSTRLDNCESRFNRLYPFLIERAAKALPRAERMQGEKKFIDGAMSDLNEQVFHRFLALVTLDRTGGDKLDFYEVHFDEAIAKLRNKARARIRIRSAREMPIELDPESGELPVAVELGAGSLDPPDDSIIFDPVFRPRLLAAIEELPKEQKEIIVMTMANIQSESNDPSIPSISILLGCHPRTVRNRRKCAIATLIEKLGLGEET
jgi:hypothetical protein